MDPVVSAPPAAIVTVGTELVLGLRPDTNAREMARGLMSAGMNVCEHVTVGDDTHALADTLRRLVAENDLVVVTGGLGPTHDDITRDAASIALDLPLAEDAAIADGLRRVAAFHRMPRAAAQVMRQALVLRGARVLPADTGTAPGQVVPTPRGELALLPGPPTEMRPMLAEVLRGHAPAGEGFAPPVVLSCAGVTESDAQVRAETALEGRTGIGLTLLADPAQVDVVLLDRGSGARALAEAGGAVREALGGDCYSAEGTSLAAVILQMLRERSMTLALAESCTGGAVGAALTDVPGASDVLKGGIVAYADAAKTGLLGVQAATLAVSGAVSAEAAAEMARGARSALDTDIALAVTGIAGPSGGSEDKPVGLVWFAIDGLGGTSMADRLLPGDRAGIRRRATVIALDTLRRYLQEE